MKKALILAVFLVFSFVLIPSLVSAVSINNNPSVDLVQVPSSVKVNQVVNFDFNATDSDNDNLSWSINWGDSTGEASVCDSINKQSGAGFKHNTSHAWKQVGAYSVQVVVSDCQGGTAKSSFTMNVSNKSTLSANVLGALDDATLSKQKIIFSSSASCAKITSTLKKGMNNSQIKCLQKILNEKGFKIKGTEGDKETMYFGEATLSAVKEFQKNHKLKVDGILGPNTRAALIK